jgi:hypothetical protein
VTTERTKFEHENEAKLGQLCKILGHHGDEDSCYDLVTYISRQRIPAFRRDLLFPSSDEDGGCDVRYIDIRIPRDAV